MKEHYPTIFGDLEDDRIEFVFDEDATLDMKIYKDGTDDYDAPYVFEVWKILAHIPLDNREEWCFEAFIEEMG